MAKISWVGCKYCIQVPSAPGPLPRRSSAPRLSRMKMNFPKVRWLRSVQGVTQAMKTTEASTTPANEGLCRFVRLYHAQNPEAGRKAINTVLFSAAIPQNRPNQSQGPSPSRSSMVNANQKITANSSAEKLVSHTQRVHQNMT